MLHPSRIKAFSGTRKWVLDVLLDRLSSDSDSSSSIKVIDHLHYAIFCLLVFMCFDERLNDKQIKDIEYVERRLLTNFTIFNMLNFWPRVTRDLLHKRWEELYQIRKEQEDVLIPLIRARKMSKTQEDNNNRDEVTVASYVDKLLDLLLPEKKRKLEEGELVSLCSEFLNAGTDTTATTLQWIMANLAKHPQIQQKLV